MGSAGRRRVQDKFSLAAFAMNLNRMAQELAH